MHWQTADSMMLARKVMQPCMPLWPLLMLLLLPSCHSQDSQSPLWAQRLLDTARVAVMGVDSSPLYNGLPHRREPLSAAAPAPGIAHQPGRPGGSRPEAAARDWELPGPCGTARQPGVRWDDVAWPAPTNEVWCCCELMSWLTCYC